MGKSTLVKGLVTEANQPKYVTFDDPTILAAATGDPQAYLNSIGTPVILDEIQRLPELLLPIKLVVDRKRTPGSFLLTGSANVLTLPKVADSLAGRMEIIELRSLSQGEIAGSREDFIDWVCGDKFTLPKRSFKESREVLFERMLTGGYPEAVERRSESRRSKWFRSYVTTIIQRDVRDLANIEGLTELPKLFSVLAARSGGLLNYADISRSVGIPQSSLKRYVALLEKLFLIEFLPAYSGNLTKRLTKSPKIFFSDSGLLAEMQGLKWPRIQQENSYAGLLAENFVFNEIVKQAGWNKTEVGMYHFRTTNDDEVDLILELPDGEIVGIEVKSGMSLQQDSFKGLRVLENSVGKKFKRGIVLYAGESAVAFGHNMFAVPIQSLWETRS